MAFIKIKISTYIFIICCVAAFSRAENVSVPLNIRIDGDPANTDICISVPLIIANSQNAKAFKGVEHSFHGLLNKGALKKELLAQLPIYANKTDADTTIWILTEIKDSFEMKGNSDFRLLGYGNHIIALFRKKSGRILPIPFVLDGGVYLIDVDRILDNGDPLFTAFRFTFLRQSYDQIENILLRNAPPFNYSVILTKEQDKYPAELHFLASIVDVCLSGEPIDLAIPSLAFYQEARKAFINNGPRSFADYMSKYSRDLYIKNLDAMTFEEYDAYYERYSSLEHRVRAVINASPSLSILVFQMKYDDYWSDRLNSNYILKSATGDYKLVNISQIGIFDQFLKSQELFIDPIVWPIIKHHEQGDSLPRNIEEISPVTSRSDGDSKLSKIGEKEVTTEVSLKKPAITAGIIIAFLIISCLFVLYFHRKK